MAKKPVPLSAMCYFQIECEVRKKKRFHFDSKMAQIMNMCEKVRTEKGNVHKEEKQIKPSVYDFPNFYDLKSLVWFE